MRLQGLVAGETRLNLKSCLLFKVFFLLRVYDTKIPLQHFQRMVTSHRSALHAPFRIHRQQYQAFTCAANEDL